jgi:hypothetical protein
MSASTTAIHNGAVKNQESFIESGRHPEYVELKHSTNGAPSRPSNSP